MTFIHVTLRLLLPLMLARLAGAVYVMISPQEVSGFPVKQNFILITWN